MPNSRTIFLSLDHLVAEMAVYPFASIAGLHSPLEELSAELDGNTGELWRRAEAELATQFPSIGIDELISVRNRTWFMGDPESTPLNRYLAMISKDYLRPIGSEAEPFLTAADLAEKGKAAARRAWRWLSFAVPPDLLLAGLSSGKTGPHRCALVSPFVQRMLQENGYAETHLHMGAGVDFPSAWSSAMFMVGSNDRDVGMKCNAFASPGACHHEGKELASWLIRAAIVRYLLGAFLKWGHRYGDFNQFALHETLWEHLHVNDSVYSSLHVALTDLYDGTIDSFPNQLRGRNGRNPDAWQTAITHSFLQLQSAYRTLSPPLQDYLPRNLDEVQKLDPLSVFFPSRSFNDPTVQIQFLWWGIDYLNHHPDDKAFARLFWQVERVRCQVYRHCIQRPMTPGLMNFIRYYERKGAITRALEKVELESCAALGGVGRGLKSLEVRTRPATSKTKQLSFFKNLDSTIDRLHQNGVEVGFALHFLKFRGDHCDDGKPLADDIENHADPESKTNNTFYRWRKFRQEADRRAANLVQAITQQPERLDLFRAIDVCRDEHGVPTWVIAPLFNTVRDQIDQVIAHHNSQYGERLPRLHTTTHVGEDFVHLTTGLRYMDEAMNYLPLDAGDRVGHGLALGIDPEAWSRNKFRQLMPREDRFFDLVWERIWHGKHGADFSSSRKTYVEDEIFRLGRTLFGSQRTFEWTVNHAVTFYNALYDGSLERLGFPDKILRAKEPTDPEYLLEKYMTSRRVYRNCRQVIWVEVYRDRDAVAELQRLVRNRYAEKGVTIEVNPISNLMVGDLTDLTSHPLWRLAPGLGDQFGAPLRMCVGSDDPLPFTTTLPEEYQFLYDSLLLAGKSHATAISWLDQIREMGMSARFTQRIPGAGGFSTD